MVHPINLQHFYYTVKPVLSGHPWDTITIVCLIQGVCSETGPNSIRSKTV